MTKKVSDMHNVVIVGAGPVGLWLGAELRLRNVAVTILEQRESISPHSKALTIHPRTIEVLAQRGLGEAFLDEGHRVPSGHFGALEQRLDFSPLDTEYPFTLLYPQALTEQLLEAHALRGGVDLRRRHRVRAIQENGDGVTVEVEGPEGDYTLDAAYVIGCDGPSSTVRKAAGIGFPGTDSTLYGFLGDVVLDDPPATVVSSSGPTGQIMIVPMSGGFHRIVGIDPKRSAPMDRDLTFEEFRDGVRAVSGTDYGMHSPIWISRYGNAARLAEHYRSGRVMLAGDAAHMHFPAGGVGMNVGLQDAHALGWRLADVLAGWADDSVLDAYDAERRAVGADLLRSTQAQTTVLSAFSPDGRALRGLLNELIAADSRLSLLLAERLSGLAVAYPSDDGAHPLVGTRFRPDDAEAVATADRAGAAVLLVPAELAEESVAAASAVDIVVVPQRGQKPTALLVRPDGYVAWAADAATAEEIRAAIDDFRSLITVRSNAA